MILVKVKKIAAHAILPKRMSKNAAGYDLYSANEKALTLKKGGVMTVPTGIAISIPHGYEAQIRPRSGLAAKHGIGVLNSPGTIDSDYRGEIKVILFNAGDKDFLLEPGKRIAQMVISQTQEIEFLLSPELDETARASGGFGHTDSTGK